MGAAPQTSAGASAAAAAPSRALGVLAMVAVAAIFTTNFVVSRYSVLHGLTPQDIVALRYAVAGPLLLPLFLGRGSAGWRSLGWWRGGVLTLLAGAPYMVLFYAGVELAPTSHAAVLNQGVVPSVVFFGLVWLGRERFAVLRVLGLCLIVVGLVLVTASSIDLGAGVLLGDVLLLLSGVSWGAFTLLAMLWNVRSLQAATAMAVLSLGYLPLYFGYWYDGFEDASVGHVIGQALQQGVLNSILAMALLTFGVRTLGAQLAALFSPAVPVLATLAAIPRLGALPPAGVGVGVGLVAVGMTAAARGRRA
ncbi:MAG: DMT family transporter [Planctomycetota bacterium]